MNEKSVILASWFEDALSPTEEPMKWVFYNGVSGAQPKKIFCEGKVMAFDEFVVSQTDELMFPRKNIKALKYYKAQFEKVLPDEDSFGIISLATLKTRRDIAVDEKRKIEKLYIDIKSKLPNNIELDEIFFG